ncbi:MAG: carbohydrate ABC transporter permease [Solirubrobacteraceae bacterium]|nr:carbohydrate ABC transporter permease [Solirubrobacteraceae bacterium]
MSALAKRRAGVILRLGAVAATLVVFLFPVYWLVTMAFKPQQEWAPTEGQIFWLPHDWTFGNFRRIFGGSATGDSGLSFLISTPIDALTPILNSLVASVGGTALALVIGTSTAYGISRFGAGGKVLPFQILQLRMFPPIAIIIPVLFLWTYLKLFDTLPGLVIIYAAITFPFVVWLMRSFFDEVPREIREAAIVDGCSELGAFRKAVLPLVRGGLATTALFVFILNWSDFLIALVLTSQRVHTAPVFLSQIQSAATGQEYGSQAALGLILIIPPVLLSILIQRHLVRGLTFGAVKR